MFTITLKVLMIEWCIWGDKWLFGKCFVAKQHGVYATFTNAEGVWTYEGV